MDASTEPTPRAGDFPRRAAVAALVAVAIAGAAGLLIFAAHAVLLIFAGLVVGVMLDALAALVTRYARLPHGWALGLVVLLLLGAMGVAGWFAAPAMVQQGRQLAEKLPAALTSGSERLFGRGSSQGGTTEPGPSGRVQQQQEQQGEPQQQQSEQEQQEQEQGGRLAPPEQEQQQQATADDGSAPLQQGLAQHVDPSMVKPVARTLGATLAALANFIVIVTIGIYAAAQPDLYVRGVVRLLPHAWRDRGAEALHESAHQLRRWMLGTLIAMTSAGLLTGIGLWLLGVPYVLALALLAAVLELVPNFGPIVAAVPAVILTAMSGDVAWWKVALLYAAVQTVQSYLIQPLTQERMIHVPPVLLIGSLVLFGWLLGTLGLLMAVPILVVASVLVKLLYLRDTLGEPITPQAAAG